jgi:hypothetical protein
MITQNEAAIVMTLVIPNSNLVMSNSEPTVRAKRSSPLKKISPVNDPMSNTDATKKMIVNKPATMIANFFFVEVTSLLLMSNTQQTLLKTVVIGNLGSSQRVRHRGSGGCC